MEILDTSSQTDKRLFKIKSIRKVSKIEILLAGFQDFKLKSF